MTFSIGMRTHARRTVDYCGETVRRLAECGALCHRDVVGFHVSHGEGLTPNANGVQALRMACVGAADWVLFLEDDIDCIDDLVGSLQRWLRRFACDDVLAYPLASFYPWLTRPQHQVGMWEIPISDYYGSQAIALRTPDAAAYADWLSAYRGPNPDAQFDIHLGSWHREQRPDVTHLRTPAPCFVDHVGEQSLLGTWSRTGRIQDFAGRSWSYRGRQLVSA